MWRFVELLELFKDNSDNKIIVRILKFIARSVLAIFFIGFYLAGILGILRAPFAGASKCVQEMFPKVFEAGEIMSIFLYALFLVAPCCVAYVMITGIRDDAVIKTEKRYESAEHSYKRYVSDEAKQIRAILDQYRIPSPDSEEIYKLLKNLEGKDNETNS